MRRVNILFACLLTSALISPSAARPARKPVPQRPAQPTSPPQAYSSNNLSQQIARLTIAGVYWGQHDTNVLPTLREAGFTITSNDKAGHKSFDEQVEIFVKEGRTLDSTYEIKAEKFNETINVVLNVAPDGWRVSSATYEYTGGLTPRELERAAIDKYQGLGFRINGQTGWNIVCLPSARYWSELPHITIKPTGGQFLLVLSGGASGDETFTKPFEDAVAKRKGLTKPTF